MNKLDTVREAIDASIIDVMGLKDSKTLDPNDTLIVDLKADSLDMIEIIMTIEEALDIEVPDDMVENLITVQDLTVAIEKLVEAQ